MPRRQTTAPSRVLVIISTVVVALVLLLASSVAATGDAVRTEAYSVHAGDTLWDIAAERTPSGGDVRDTVAAIRSINRLTGTLIRPGQAIEVPAG